MMIGYYQSLYWATIIIIIIGYYQSLYWATYVHLLWDRLSAMASCKTTDQIDDPILTSL